MNTVLWMMGTLASFSFMAIAARELSGTIDTFQILFFRSLLGLIIISLLIFAKKDLSLLSTKRLKQHFARNITHFGGQYGWFLGLSLLPLATVFALEFTVPLWTASLCHLIGSCGGGHHSEPGQRHF